MYWVLSSQLSQVFRGGYVLGVIYSQLSKVFRGGYVLGVI